MKSLDAGAQISGRTLVKNLSKPIAKMSVPWIVTAIVFFTLGRVELYVGLSTTLNSTPAHGGFWAKINSTVRIN